VALYEHTVAEGTRYDPSVSDAWSLGVTLLACATSRVPWDRASFSDKRFAAWHASICEGSVRWAAHLSPLFTDLLLGCLQLDPVRRLTPQQLAAHAFWATHAAAAPSAAAAGVASPMQHELGAARGTPRPALALTALWPSPAAPALAPLPRPDGAVAAAPSPALRDDDLAHVDPPPPATRASGADTLAAVLAALPCNAAAGRPGIATGPSPSVSLATTAVASPAPCQADGGSARLSSAGATPHFLTPTMAYGHEGRESPWRGAADARGGAAPGTSVASVLAATGAPPPGRRGSIGPARPLLIPAGPLSVEIPAPSPQSSFAGPDWRPQSAVPPEGADDWSPTRRAAAAAAGSRAAGPACAALSASPALLEPAGHGAPASGPTDASTASLAAALMRLPFLPSSDPSASSSASSARVGPSPAPDVLLSEDPAAGRAVSLRIRAPLAVRWALSPAGGLLAAGATLGDAAPVWLPGVPESDEGATAGAAAQASGLGAAARTKRRLLAAEDDEAGLGHGGGALGALAAVRAAASPRPASRRSPVRRVRPRTSADSTDSDDREPARAAAMAAEDDV
jgi:hypothetical protein